MQLITEWLNQLGLSEYAERFAENGINAAALAHLTDQDLKDIGVLLGHRRIMLAAISKLANAASGSVPLAEPKPQDTAERRQVTVMFSDLVGSTALSTRMDPEDLREVISAYQKCVAETVRRFGGFVAKYMGDGVLIYFGYPQANEDDAERAVRAGLELIAAVSALSSRVPLQTRVGIATGLVVVGDLIGSGEAQERGIVGETPNLAARLQGIAVPNMVVIAKGTRRLLGDLFELQDLGPKDLKGLAGPVRAWAVLRPSTVVSRFEALRASGTTALVGRDAENDLLLQCWTKAKASEGQVVSLTGEAGIGKSRLTAALLERLASESHTPLRYFCSPQHTDSAFYPIIGQMERAAGLKRDDTSFVKLNKLDVLLAQTSTSKENAALFADLLSLPNDGRYPAIDLTAQQRRQRMLQVLGAQLTRLASQCPVLMIFEDVHWIDPTSLEALKRTVDQIKNIPVLLIVTFRPEFVAPWVAQSHVTSIILNRLGGHDAAAIIASLAGARTLPSDVTAEIVERTDGIPLFVEEMTKAVLEAESEGVARQTAAAVPISVPASLHASLMARLDRLGVAKDVAQVGAAIGREFSQGLLAAVADKQQHELETAINRLVEAGILFQHGLSPNPSYVFKHALVQDAAYDTLLRERRRALHARIADTLENQFADIAETQPAVVARHCTEAGLIERAAALWGKAGQRSLAHSALAEAVAQFNRALEHIATLPDTPILRREQIKLQVALAATLFHVKGYTSPDTMVAFERADTMIERAEALGERPEGEDILLRFSVMYGQWTGNFTAGNFAKAAQTAEQFLLLAERQTRSAPLLMAHRVMGASLAVSGEFKTAKSHLDQAVALYVPSEHRPLAARFGQDIGIAALAYRALVLYRLGYPESALKDSAEGLRSARELGQAGTLVYEVFCAGILEVLCKRFKFAEERVDELFALSEKYALPAWKVVAGLMGGWVFAATHRADQAIKLLRSSLTALANAGTTYLAPFSLMWIAHAHASCGRVTEAERSIAEALDAVNKTNERWDEAEIHRIAGELVVSSRPDAPEIAEPHLQRSLEIARRQGAKSLELRAATSLARLRCAQGRRDESLRLLVPIFDWFTEGSSMSDLMEAKALLEELLCPSLPSTQERRTMSKTRSF